MLFDLHDFILRLSGSLEVATVVAGTTIVYLGILRYATQRQLRDRPDSDAELVRSYHGRALVVSACAGVLIALAFAFDVRGQLFGSPSAGMRGSAVAFIFVAWAVVVTAILRRSEAQLATAERARRKSRHGAR